MLIDKFILREAIINVSKYTSLIRKITEDFFTLDEKDKTNKKILNKYKFDFNNREEEIIIYIDYSDNPPNDYATFRDIIFDEETEYSITIYYKNCKDLSKNELKNIIIHEFTHAIDFLTENPPTYDTKDFLENTDFYKEMKNYLISLNPKNRNESFILNDSKFKEICNKHKYPIDDTFKKKLHAFIHFAGVAEQKLDKNMYYNSKGELYAYTNEIISELEDEIEKGLTLKSKEDLNKSKTYVLIKNKISKKNWQVLVNDIFEYFKIEQQKDNAIIDIFKKIFDIR